MEYISVLYAYLGSFGFSLVSQMRGKICFLIGIGGALGWLVYLLCSPLGNEIISYFLATVAAAVYSEIMARVMKKPVTCFIIAAVIPLVPGAGMYFTMEHGIKGETSLFTSTLLHTLCIAGALAVGIVLVSAVFRLIGHRRGKECPGKDPLGGKGG